MPVALPEDALDGWCRQHLGSPPVEELFRSGYLSAVVGLRLADGREVVVKARQPSPRLDACFRVHQHAYRAGFPCPEPLVPPCALADLTATAEAHAPGGHSVPATASAELYARPLARLVGLLARMNGALDLEPPLPWLGWAHEEPGLWPSPDDRDVDLNDYPDPWLDGIAARLRARMARDHHPRVLGHGDWYPPNLRWAGDKLLFVHDWDSIARHSEAALAGAIASMFCVVDGATSLEETQAFLAAYADERGTPWSDDELEVAWAAGLWRMAFDAKKQTVSPPRGINPQHVREQAKERLRRAGA